MVQTFEGIEIKALASCVPPRIIENDYFETLLSTKELRMFEKTVGIVQRRWADPDVTAVDLGEAAAAELLSVNNINTSEIECLIFLSQTPDFRLPFSSNILQNRLGFSKEQLCLDINAGCAGFVQGLSVAYSIAQSGSKGKVLLIVAETMSKLLSKHDRSTSMLFGDGASAILIENTGRRTAKAYLNCFADGEFADTISIPDGGFRNGVTEDSFVIETDASGNQKNRLQLAMDGGKVFDFTLREVAPSIEALLAVAGIEKTAIDHYLLHQSNQYIIRQIANILDLPFERFLLNIGQYGNTSGVSIPLLLSTYGEKITRNQTLCLSGYGVGLNWGNCILQNTEISISAPIVFTQ